MRHIKVWSSPDKPRVETEVIAATCGDFLAFYQRVGNEDSIFIAQGDDEYWTEIGSFHKHWVPDLLLAVQDLHRATTVKELYDLRNLKDDLLKGIESLGWPCRLIELPAHYQELSNSFYRLKTALENLDTKLVEYDDGTHEHVHRTDAQYREAVHQLLRKDRQPCV